ncbi:Hpt domain-containing protein [Teredinibacter turnerae]|uniref:Hpt domain-containing protein n=1 Tax=Teredinibacter turnerae TaxID=2426 RepID=UPI00036F2067|nr:Hpt domain-containing protein [Teredinibacter turnerae]
MSDKRNFAALDWVIEEIDETLKEARQALESFVEDSKDATKMRFCLTYIHQVHGSLQMVEFHGASLLAEEMEHLAQALMDNKVTSVPEAQEVLMRSLLQLPTYLDHVKAQKEDNPGLVLPLLNDLRAVRNQSYLSETNLFSPDLSLTASVSGQRHPITTDKSKLQQVLKKLREMYQFAAASVLRGIKVDENLGYLDKVFSRLEALTAGTQCHPIWEVSAALIEGLLRDDIELSVAVRGLLRHLARELRLMGEKAPGSLDATPRESLLKNLLYYVARAEDGGKKINRVKARYNLKNALLAGVTIGDSNDKNSLSAPDPDAIRSVVVALNEEINSIKHVLDTCLTGQGQPEDLREVLPVVKRVADTLAILGIGDLRKHINQQIDVLTELSELNTVDEARLLDVAGKIIEIEHRLEAIAKVVGTNRDLASVNEREIEIDQAKVTVIKECQHGLEQAKDAIVEYISSKWDKSHLLNVGSLLHDIRGGLEIIPLPRPAAILDRCAAYIQAELIERDEQPGWNSLDTLADAIASVEYYLERRLDDMDGDPSSLLDVAEESMASLGYPLLAVPSAGENSAPSEPEAPTAAVNDAPAAEPEPEPQPGVSLDAITVDDDEPEIESDIDDEIIEIFIEEAGEVRETLDEYFPKWRANFQDQDSLVVVRRAFHTLKGSGRMVEAYDIGELAWSIENMLNRVIDNTVNVGPAHGHMIELVLHVLPVLVTAFERRKRNPQKALCEQYMAWAESLAAGDIPAELAAVPDGGHPQLPDLTAPPKKVVAAEQQQETAAAEPEPQADISGDEDDSDNENLVLWEIFSSEAQSHLATMNAFIAKMEADAPLYSPPSDDFQRALHTLKGSAKMAQVTPIAAMAEPLEAFAKELISYQVDINEDILQLYRDAVSYTAQALTQLEAGENLEIRQLDQFVARTAELRELAVGHLIRLKDQEKEGQQQVDPRLLSIFMAEEMNLLLDADQLIADWQEKGGAFEHGASVVSELSTLGTGARQANLPDMAGLAAQLCQLYNQADAGHQLLNDDFFTILSAGHNTLLDMVDAVAAGQNVSSPSEEITSALASLIHHGEEAAALSTPLADASGAAGADRPIEEPFEEQSPTSTDEQLVDAPDESSADDDLVISIEPEAPADNVLTADFSSPFSDEELNDDDHEPLGDEHQITLSDDEQPPVLDTPFEGDILPDEGTYTVDDLPTLTVDESIPSFELDANPTDSAVESGFETDTPADSLIEQPGGDAFSGDDGVFEIDSSEAISADDITLDEPQGSDSGSASLVGDDLVTSGFGVEVIDATGDLPSENDVSELTPSEFGQDISADATMLSSEAGLTTTPASPEGDASAEHGASGEHHASEDEGSADGAPVSLETIDNGISEVADMGEQLLADLDSPDVVQPPNVENFELEAETSQAGAPAGQESDTQAQEPAQTGATVAGLLDTIDVNDEDFDQDILDIFLEEADELIEQLDEAVHAWESDWSDLSQAEEIKRVLHTLKGGARLAGMTNLGELTHNYESFLIGSKLQEVDDTFFRTMHSYQDQVLTGVRAIQAFVAGDLDSAEASADVPAEVSAEIPPADPSESDTGVDEASADQDATPQQTMAPAPESNVVPFAPKPKAPDVGEFTMPSPAPTPGGQAIARKPSGPQEVIKVSAELLEELVNLAGETSINRARIEQQVSDFSNSLDDIDSTLFRLQEQLRRLDIETEAQVLFRQEQMAAHEDFDPLEMDRYSHLQQLSRSLIESASDLIDLRETLTDNIRDTETLLLQQSRINTTLQEGLMRSRMVPFSRLVPRLRRIVRQVSSELGKSVSFELDNVEGELDRSVLERMVPPLEHMLRNAVDHGVEAPEDRLSAGKSETGRIVLTLGREGGDVIIRLADDGRGIDLRRVREKAIERGLMSADAGLSDFDVMQFILHAGFSTAEKVTQISGRGVGLDVVTSEIKALGGSVTIDSAWGKGTEFIVRLPFTVSVNRALMVEIGQDTYAIPLNTIEGIVRVSPFELEHYYTTEDARFEYAGENYQVRYLGSMLSNDTLPQLDGHALPLPVLLVRSADNAMAVQVDNLLGSREVVVKSLGVQFSAVQGLSGATLMGDGSVVVILDPHALMRKEIANAKVIEMRLRDALPPVEAPEDTTKTVMVVDDSVTVRKVTTRFLEREGFNVTTAKDGVDALRVLQDDDIPDLMLLDIEMPRMDGFEVAKNIRSSSRLRHLPIIMITSRTGDKHRERAMSLGVNKYLGKPYQEELLLSSIAELLEEAKAR